MLCFPGFHAIPEIDDTNSETFIIVNFAQKTVIIGGTQYGGEIKKSIFTILNYLLPRTPGAEHALLRQRRRRRATWRCSSGSPARARPASPPIPSALLIGDDEHGWCDDGVFNFEGGCYAKVIRLSPESEPDIYECTRRFGTVLENVAIDFDDAPARPR